MTIGITGAVLTDYLCTRTNGLFIVHLAEAS